MSPKKRQHLARAKQTLASQESGIYAESRRHEGYSFEQIARRLHITPRRARQLVAKTTRRYRRAVVEEYAPNGDGVVIVDYTLHGLRPIQVRWAD